MKLALGTVQFGLNYGITNKRGKTTISEVKEIINYAQEYNIKMLDTSPAYGDSEKILGDNIDLNHFQVITKLKYINQQKITAGEISFLQETFEKSLEQLRSRSVYGVLIHNTEDIFKENNELLYEFLMKLKKNRKVRKIGISVYSIDQIEKILSMPYSFDIIQLPVNVFDQRLLKSDILKRIKLRGIEIHARSIFLQGVLLNDPALLPEKFNDDLLTIERYFADIKQSNFSKVEAALHFVQGIKEIDYIVVGVNDFEQLQEITDAYERNLDRGAASIVYENYVITNEEVIDPRNW